MTSLHFIMFLVAAWCVLWTFAVFRLLRSSLQTGRITFWRIDWLTIWIWGPSVAEATRPLTFWLFLILYGLSIVITILLGSILLAGLSLGEYAPNS